MGRAWAALGLGLLFAAAALGPVRAAGRAPVYYRHKVVVLMFHAVQPDPTGDTVSPQTFAQDLATLRQDGFHVISVGQATRYLSGRGKVPDNAVVITFDDGYRDVYTYAFPLLERYRMPAVEFLITSWVGSPQHPNTLTWPEVEAMARSGLITFGCHTANAHFALPIGPDKAAPATLAHWYRDGRAETEAQYEARMLADSRSCAGALRTHLGYVPPYYAFPYGAYDPQLIRLVEEAGFRYMFTTLGWANRPGEDVTKIFRINVGTARTTPADLVGAILDVVAQARRYPGYRAPAAVVPTW